MKKLFIADLLPNRLHEKVMASSIYYITKSRLDVQFIKYIALEMVIVNRWKKMAIIRINHGFYIKLSIHLLIKRICN